MLRKMTMNDMMKNASIVFKLPTQPSSSLAAFHSKPKPKSTKTNRRFWRERYEYCRAYVYSLPVVKVSLSIKVMTWYKQEIN